MNVGGRDVTDYLQKILQNRGYFIDNEIAEDIKTKLCYIPDNSWRSYEDEMEKYASSTDYEKKYELPDGEMISIGNERFRAPEIMFKPNLIGKSAEGIHKLIYESIIKTDMDIRRELYCNIVLSGGNTLFPGIYQRLHREVYAWSPSGIKVKIVWIASNENKRQYLPWIGGSILASLSTFQEIWITRDDYKEYGPAIVHRKCF